MKQIKDRAIVLSRVDYGERDRIITFLGKKSGKVSALAKSVRSAKSRLAGGIELLSESDITLIEGRTDLRILSSSRLIVHFSNLAKDMRRMQLAFKHIKTISKIADEAAGQEYYPVLFWSFSALDDDSYEPAIVDLWYVMQILGLSGSLPNLTVKQDLDYKSFDFDHDSQKFFGRPEGIYTQNDLKLLRLCAASSQPPKLKNPLGSEDRLQSLSSILLKTNLTEV